MRLAPRPWRPCTCACNELTSGASDMAIAGGCDTLQNAMGYQCFDSAGALSPRGRCRPFDASADGIAISEGLAAVVLKRREDAERDGDRIYAIIRGVGTGSDGRTKGLTAPGAEGQRRTLERAYRQARIDPATVALIEAHGTGTARGDVVEATTLSDFLKDHGARSQSCAIGSVKSNVGHTKCAAGVAGLIKAALSLYHGVLPPTMHVEKPNPEAFPVAGPLCVNSELRPWIRAGSPRRAGVSAFGFGGTNFHVVLEEYAHDMAVRDGLMPRRQLPAELLLFSGSSHSELRQQLAEVRDLVREAEGRAVDLASLAYQVHRRSWHAPSSRRVALVAESVEELKVQIEWLLAQVELDTRLASTAPPGMILGDAPSKGSPSIAFLFPGQGAQYPRMLDELAVQFSEVRLAFERLDRTLGRNISACVFPPPAFENDERSRQIKRLMATDVAQPALGATGVGLTRLLASFGVRPNMTGGHSYGELTALVRRRRLGRGVALPAVGRSRGGHVELRGAQSDAQRGAMLAVLASEAAARAELAACDGVFLANVNGPRQVVIGGRAAAVRLAQQHLEARGIVATPLAVNFAFHTPHMRPAGEAFAAACARTLFQSPKRPPSATSLRRPTSRTPRDSRQARGASNFPRSLRRDGRGDVRRRRAIVRRSRSQRHPLATGGRDPGIPAARNDSPSGSRPIRAPRAPLRSRAALCSRRERGRRSPVRRTDGAGTGGRFGLPASFRHRLACERRVRATEGFAAARSAAARYGGHR